MFSTIVKMFIIISVAAIVAANVLIAAENDNSQTNNNSNQILALDHRISEIEAKITSINETYRLILNIAQIAVAIGGLIGLFLMIDRWKERKRVEVEAARTHEWYEQLLNRQEKNNDKLFKSVSDNIDEASSLFRALNTVISFEKRTEKMEKDLIEKQKKIRSGVIRDLNAEAINICQRVTRSNYSAIDHQEVIHEFSIKHRQYTIEYSIETNEISSACYLVRGIDLHIRNIDDRLKLLEQSCDTGLKDLQRAPSEELCGNMSSDAFREWTKKCINEAFYHLAIVLYNAGEYKQAISKFEKAIKFNDNDISSRLYIPEAKFLGFLETDFNKIISEFVSIAEFIQDNDQIHKLTQEQKNSLLSLTYVRLGNCYYAKSKYEPYLKYRSLQKAIDNYAKAKELSPTFYLASFSYAQALKAWALQLKSDTNNYKKLSYEAEQLFASVLSRIRDKLAATSEPKIRLMLFYMLAICAKEGNIRGELPQTYIAQIHSEKGNLGNDPRLRIFSPRTKNDLSINEFIQEIEEYQSQFKSFI